MHLDAPTGDSSNTTPSRMTKTCLAVLQIQAPSWKSAQNRSGFIRLCPLEAGKVAPRAQGWSSSQAVILNFVEQFLPAAFRVS